ncbi:MAG: hypothetical protein VCG02_20215, partial [Verrucomicrobiota bacterium]
HIFLWLMSCRVLKRGMEFAMRDVLIERAQARGLQKIIGEYRESAKNQRVENLYAGRIDGILHELAVHRGGM